MADKPMARRLVDQTNELVVRMNNLWSEQRLGISTRGVTEIGHEDAVDYATMGYRTIWRVLRHLELGPVDVFVDIGCGRGRVLCCAARHPVEHVHGVDVSPELCEAARANAEHLRGRKAPITVRNTVAQDFDYSDATVLYMFDPFGPATLRQVLDKVRSDRDEGDVRIAYANPTHEAVVDEQPWLEPAGRWGRDEDRIEHSVAFYRSRA